MAPQFLSKAERSFYGVLADAVDGRGLIFAKVRVADVLAPRKGLDRSAWTRAFNRISAKHFDFVICEPGDCSVQLAVELDDSTHSKGKRRDRDRFLDEACESAGLPLLRVRAARAYAVAEIRDEIEQQILRWRSEPVSDAPAEMPAEPEPVAPEVPVIDLDVSEPVADVASEPQFAPETPSCPRCSEPMVLRTAQAGSRAGESFWGCSRFPGCHGILTADG
jgi:very-short-patch-repair endonuclease